MTPFILLKSQADLILVTKRAPLRYVEGCARENKIPVVEQGLT